MHFGFRSCAWVFIGAAVAGCGLFGKDADLDTKKQALTAGVHQVDGNPTCADYGLGTVEFKADPPNSGTYSLGDGINSVTVTTDGTSFDWTSTLGIDAVISKGGNGANIYVYDPEATGGTGLHSPDNGSGGAAGLSHISFCYDYELAVTKTAKPSFKRTWTWGIDKTSDGTTLLLTPGQTYLMGYAVTVSTTGSTDSDWAVSGEITVKNPAPFPATVTGVTDDFAGGALPVTCPVTFPHVLAAGASFTCTYASALGAATNGTNTATATATGAVEGGSGTATVNFGTATPTGVDACITVDDDKYPGDFGKVCAGDAPKTFTYELPIGPYAACGVYEYKNTASFVADDSGATGADSVTVTSTLDCDKGCTLTQGYWKTHSSYGPAPYDDLWAQLPAGADTAFFISGMSYYQALWTKPAGNAYAICAHQYIAAQLNMMNGASVPANVQTAFDTATTLFQTYTPAQVAAMSKGDPVRKQLISLATTLDQYNNGVTGPGHCSE